MNNLQAQGFRDLVVTPDETDIADWKFLHPTHCQVNKSEDIGF
jgi:hypothetical protein